MTLPLEGIRVLECGVMHVGPAAAAELGDLGAEIIKIEPRITGEISRGTDSVFGNIMSLPGGRNAMFEHTNRNKKGITLDITKAKGKEVIYRLVKKSDVFLQNLRPGALKRAKLDYETLSSYNPRLIYASGSGYGPKGPDAEQPSIDLVGVARSGWLAHVGRRQDPPLYPGMCLSDQLAARDIVYGVMTALFVRERFGYGQEVNVSILGSAMGVQAIGIASSLLLGRDFGRPKVRATAINPLWCYYRCKDDRWIALGMGQFERFWRPFCQAIGRPDLPERFTFRDRGTMIEECEQVIGILDEVFATRTLSEWLDVLSKDKEFLVAPVQQHIELPDDPQVVANRYVVDFDHPTLGKVKMLGHPVSYSKTPVAIQRCAPELGEHTEEVLLELGGYSWDEIVQLREEEVI